MSKADSELYAERKDGDPDCGSGSCMFMHKGGMRPNGPCRCLESAGFHSSAFMAVKQLLREVLQLRSEKRAGAFSAAKSAGADYVRCRACANTGAPLMRNKSWIALDDTCQPLNGPDDMLCPCGKLREPYDCQADEWMKA